VIPLYHVQTTKEEGSGADAASDEDNGDDDDEVRLKVFNP
jgi:hypothetical protein